MTGVELTDTGAKGGARRDAAGARRAGKSRGGDGEGVPGRFAHYFVTKGWAHLLLLAGVGIFLFPFVWMVATSMKTDEELPEPGIFPAIPVFQASSPFARRPPTLERPANIAPDKWAAAVPVLLDAARAETAKAPLPPGTGGRLDEAALRESAAHQLVNKLAGKLNKELWNEPPTVLAAFRELFRPATQPAAATTQPAAAEAPKDVREAMDERLGRFELRKLQLRTLDAHIVNLCNGTEMLAQWKVESGPGSLILGASDTAYLAYDFKSSSSEPVVLRYEFDFPADPENLHKLMLTMKGDDSWHRVDATLDLAGVRWATDYTTYVAQHRPASIIFQPPTFDDTTNKARTWIPLKRAGTSDVKPGKAVLRLVLAPSSTVQAIWGKVQRNYARAFFSVPFWTYVVNSVLLVVLTLMGALFSASFVAYAFARLNWPGRSVAFIVLLSTMMLPGQVMMVPRFMIWRELGWYNTLNPMWVPAWFGIAFFIFLMVQHMKTIPKELEEAARLDGLNAVQTWWYIILPQCKPTMAAIAIMTFMGSWNEFMGPLIYLRDQEKFPLSLGLFGIRVDQANDWTMIMAGNVLMTLPVIVIFFLFQRYFIEGVTMSGMKG